MKPFLALALVISFSFFTPGSAVAKEWTIEARQAELMKQINVAQEKKALTAKEGEKLRKKLSNVAKKKTKWMQDKTRELTEDEKLKLEAMLNEVSVDIKDWQLQKRTEKPSK